MRLPAQIEPWLSTVDLQVWVREAADKGAYQRRLAIWLTASADFPRIVWPSCCASPNKPSGSGLPNTINKGRKACGARGEEGDAGLGSLGSRRSAFAEAAGGGGPRAYSPAQQLRAELEKLTGRRCRWPRSIVCCTGTGGASWGRVPAPPSPAGRAGAIQKNSPVPPSSDPPASSPGAGALAVSRRSPLRLHQRSAPLRGSLASTPLRRPPDHPRVRLRFGRRQPLRWRTLLAGLALGG